MYRYTNCPVCNGNDFKEVLRAKDYTVSKETFGVSHCMTCTHRFTNPVPNQEEIGPYYKSEDYVSHTNTSKGLIFRLYQMVRRRTLRSKRRLLETKTGKQGGRHLDIGSGAGAFLATMKKAGWETLGLEPDPDARAVANRDFGVDALPVEEFFMQPLEHYDAITMWHVLEHVHRLDDYMRQLKQCLKHDGRLFIAVPNYTSGDGQRYGADWAAYDVPRHLYHFSPSSMRALIERHGLKLLEMKRMPYDAYYVSMLTERNLGGSLIRAIWSGWRSNIGAWGNVERCSSLIYIVSK